LQIYGKGLCGEQFFCAPRSAVRTFATSILFIQLRNSLFLLPKPSQMSHQHHHIRNENICLNCSADTHGRYCHVCGQENLEPRETVVHMTQHFFEDMTHFDGKFFNTLKFIITKPGFLAQEYVQGRRMRYLHPVRMYLLTSAIFFVVLFSFFVKPMHYDVRKAFVRDSIEQHNTTTTFAVDNDNYPGIHDNVLTLHFNKAYAVNGEHVYDSLQQALPKTQRADFVSNFLFRKYAGAASAYHANPTRFIEAMFDHFTHSFSKVFFVSLPFFAAILALLYVRRKNYYFAAHTVFAIHYYCVFFVLLMLLITQTMLIPDANSDLWYNISLVTVPLTILGTYAYLYIAMKRFYKQGWFKTFVKFSIQSVAFFIILLSLTFVSFLNSMAIE
jgi:hypothetical protein